MYSVIGIVLIVVFGIYAMDKNIEPSSKRGYVIIALMFLFSFCGLFLELYITDRKIKEEKNDNLLIYERDLK